jgi:hypothetical protein
VNTAAVALNLRSYSIVAIATGYGLDDWGVTTRVQVGSRIFSTSSKLVPGPTQPPIPWVPGLFPQWWSGRGVKLTIRLHLVPSSRMAELYRHSPICLRGIVLNELSTGTTLPFTVRWRIQIVKLISMQLHLYFWCFPFCLKQVYLFCTLFSNIINILDLRFSWC